MLISEIPYYHFQHYRNLLQKKIMAINENIIIRTNEFFK